MGSDACTREMLDRLLSILGSRVFRKVLLTFVAQAVVFACVVQAQTADSVTSQKEENGAHITIEDSTAQIELEPNRKDHPEEPHNLDVVRDWIFKSSESLLTLIGTLLVLGLVFAPKGTSNRIEQMIAPFQSVKLFGAEFVISRSAGEDVEVKIERLRGEVQFKFDKWAGKHNIRKLHKTIVDTQLKPIVDLAKHKVRTAIYVPDLLFSETLYQLTDYYPRSRGPRGRAFSARFGMIGKAWRLEESHYEPCVPTDPRDLKLGWGMVQKEANGAAHGKESFACFVFKSKGGKTLGILYVDSPDRNLFGESEDSPLWKKLQADVQSKAEKEGLIEKLEQLHEELIQRSARVKIYSE